MLLETSLNFVLIFYFDFIRGFLDIGLFYLVAWKSVGRHDYKIHFSLFKSSPNQHFFTIFSYLHFPHCVSQPQMIPQVFNQNDRKWLKLLSGNSFRWAGHTFRFSRRVSSSLRLDLLWLVRKKWSWSQCLIKLYQKDFISQKTCGRC